MRTITSLYSIVNKYFKDQEGRAFPACRGSFPGAREKRDLCHGSKMAILSMLRGLATEPSRDVRST